MIIEKILMQEAIKQAKIAAQKDEVPIGAVISLGGKIIAKAHNQVETLKDPTAHAEMIAITQATNTLGQKWLNNCTLFVTIEPCSMCAGALVLARIKKICFGAKDPKGGACGSVVNISGNPLLNHKIKVKEGLFESECAQLMSNFFKSKRAKGE